METNNCFADGVQLVTGCSFGNNALIYRDYGKTAVTLTRRDGRAIRLALNQDFEDSRENKYPETYDLFNRLVAQRQEGSPEEFARMMQLFSEISFAELGVSIEEMFDISQGNISVPEFAPIFESVRCDECGENVMKSRVIEKEGKNYCIPCARSAYHELNGSGILAKGRR